MQSRKILFKYGTPVIILSVLITAFLVVIGSPETITAVTPTTENVFNVLRMEVTGEIQGEIEGEITDAGQEGWIEVLGYSHQIIIPRDAESRLPTGSRQHSPLRIVKTIDKASPLLANALIMNEKLTIKLHLFKPNDLSGFDEFFTIELQEASIASIQTQGSGISYGETVSFCYMKIIWTYVDDGTTAEDTWETPIE